MKNKKWLVVILIFLIPCLIFNIKIFFEEQKVSRSVSYRVCYSNEKCSKIYKKGKKTRILNANIKKIIVNNKLDTGQTIVFYDGKEWSEKKTGDSDIYGVKIYNSRKYREQYRTCYRTFNIINKWLNWTCSDYIDPISGNAKQPIKAIQIKVIPVDANIYDYLEDVYENKNSINYDFQGGLK